MTIPYDDFNRVEMRVGRVVRAEPFPEARQPSLRLWIDFGSDVGVRKSSAQVAANYEPADLEGRLVVAVTNFAPRQIGKFMSEVLVLGVPDAHGNVVLLGPERDVPTGGRVY
jgi:tRNA-binding protein